MFIKPTAKMDEEVKLKKKIVKIFLDNQQNQSFILI